MPTIIDDPEKGTSEHIESSALANIPLDDDKKALSVTVSSALPSTKGLVATKKSQIKVTRWVRFKLWFNTYRYVSVTNCCLGGLEMIHFNPANFT